MVGFVSNNVSVDEKFARFDSKSFAINKITSVDVRETVIPASRMFLILALIAVVCLITALNKTVSEAIGYVIATIVLCGFAWLSWRNSKPVTTYHLYLHTAGSEVQAYSTQGRDEILELRGALESAMAAS